MLPRDLRLRQSRDFKLVYSRGKSYAHPMLVLYARPVRAPGTRVGFSISKKLGSAVERNRIKRRLREVVRAERAKLRPGFDVVFVGRSRLRGAALEEVRAAVVQLARRARLTEFEPEGAPGLDPTSRGGAPCAEQSRKTGRED